MPNSSATCFAVVGLKDFDLLALGAASGHFTIFNNLIIFFSLGILTAIVSRFLFASLDIFEFVFFLKHKLRDLVKIFLQVLESFY